MSRREVSRPELFRYGKKHGTDREPLAAARRREGPNLKVAVDCAPGSRNVRVSGSRYRRRSHNTHVSSPPGRNCLLSSARVVVRGPHAYRSPLQAISAGRSISSFGPPGGTWRKKGPFFGPLSTLWRAPRCATIAPCDSPSVAVACRGAQRKLPRTAPEGEGYAGEFGVRVSLRLVLALTGFAGTDNDLALVSAARTRPLSRACFAEAGSDVNATQPDGASALHSAAYRDVATRRTLIRAGARVNAQNEVVATPLWVSSTHASAAMIGRLLKAGADTNAALPGGETPLMTATRAGGADAVKLLSGPRGDRERRGSCTR